MQTSPAAIAVQAYCQAQQRVLKLVEQMTDDQLSWRPTPVAQTIAFHVWHIARWADHLQASIPGMTAELGRRLGPGLQIWQRDALAERWGFDTDRLGFAATGMQLADELAQSLPFPEQAALLAYVRPVFEAAERAVQAIDDEQFNAPEQPQPLSEGIWGGGPVGQAIIAHVVHINRHLGAIECLYGCQTGSGTATV